MVLTSRSSIPVIGAAAVMIFIMCGSFANAQTMLNCNSANTIPDTAGTYILTGCVSTQAPVAITVASGATNRNIHVTPNTMTSTRCFLNEIVLQGTQSSLVISLLGVEFSCNGASCISANDIGSLTVRAADPNSVGNTVTSTGESFLAVATGPTTSLNVVLDYTTAIVGKYIVDLQQSGGNVGSISFQATGSDLTASRNIVSCVAGTVASLTLQVNPVAVINPMATYTLSATSNALFYVTGAVTPPLVVYSGASASLEGSYFLYLSSALAAPSVGTSSITISSSACSFDNRMFFFGGAISSLKLSVIGSTTMTISSGLILASGILQNSEIVVTLTQPTNIVSNLISGTVISSSAISLSTASASGVTVAGIFSGSESLSSPISCTGVSLAGPMLALGSASGASSSATITGLRCPVRGDTVISTDSSVSITSASVLLTDMLMSFTGNTFVFGGTVTNSGISLMGCTITASSMLATAGTVSGLSVTTGADGATTTTISTTATTLKFASTLTAPLVAPFFAFTLSSSSTAFASSTSLMSFSAHATGVSVTLSTAASVLATTNVITAVGGITLSAFTISMSNGASVGYGSSSANHAFHASNFVSAFVTLSGASMITSLNAGSLFFATAVADAITVDMSSASRISAQSATLFHVSAGTANSIAVTVAGGSSLMGARFAFLDVTDATSTSLTASGAGSVVSFSGNVFECGSSCTVSTLSLGFASGTALTVGSGIIRLSGSFTHQDITLSALSISSTSSVAAFLITTPGIISSFLVSLDGANTISTTSVPIDGALVSGTITLANGFVLLSSTFVIRAEATTVGISMLTASSITSVSSDAISLGGNSQVSIACTGGSTWAAATRLLTAGSSTALSISVVGSSLIATGTPSTIGALYFRSTISDVTITLSTTSASFSDSSLLRFAEVVTGTNVISIHGGTISNIQEALVLFEKGFSGTSMSVLMTGTSTITALNHVIRSEHQGTASSDLSTFLFSGATITILTSAATGYPAVMYVANSPTIRGAVWTITECGITNSVTVAGTYTFSYYSLVGITKLEIVNSIGPQLTVSSTALTSAATTFAGVRFDGTGTVSGNSNPKGSILLERLTLSLSTKAIALISAPATITISYMDFTFRCVDIATTSTPLVDILGWTEQSAFLFVGVQLKQTLSIFGAVNLPWSSGGFPNRYLSVTYINSHIHAPIQIYLDPALLAGAGTPVPPSTITIMAACSWGSNTYAMSAGTFGTPLNTAFAETNCYPNPYLNCMVSWSGSYTFTETPTQTPSPSVSASWSGSESPSADVTWTPFGTWTNYSFSNSSDISASKSQSSTFSVSQSGSKDPTATVRSLTESLSPTTTASVTMDESASHSNSVSLTPSLTWTGTLTDSLPPPTDSVSASSSDSPQNSASESTSPSLSASVSISFTPSLTATATNDLSASKTTSSTYSITTSVSEEVSSTKSSSFTQSKSHPSFSSEETASKSHTTTPSVTFTTTASEEQTASESRSVSVSLSVTPTATSTVTPSDSPSGSITESSSASMSLTDEVSESRSQSLSVSASVSVSESPTLSGSPTRSATVDLSRSSSLSPSETPSTTHEVSESRSGSETSSPTEDASMTPSLTPTTTSSLSPSDSRSVTASFTNDASRSSTTSESTSPTGTPSPSLSGSVSDDPTTSASVTETATTSRVTLSEERTQTKTLSITGTRSDITEDTTLTASVSSSRLTSSPSRSSEVTMTVFSATESISAPHSVSMSRMRATHSMSGSVTGTYTLSLTSSPSAQESYSYAMTKNITPSRGTFTLSTTRSTTQQVSISVSASRMTPTRTAGTASSELTLTESNSSTPSSDVSASESKTRGTRTRTVSVSESQQVTVTVTQTVTPPPTLTETRSITEVEPGPLSALQLAVSFFGTFFANGQHCATALWYVVGICMMLWILEALGVAVMYVLGDLLQKHPETEDGISVVRSLVVQSTYVSVFLPCHYRCALLHSLIALLHIAILVSVYFAVAVRLYLDSTSPMSLRVIVTLASATAPHLITNPLRQLLFRFTFNTKKLEKAWLKYCDITGRHQSKEYFPTVKETDSLQKVLQLSKTRVAPTDEEVAYEKGKDAYYSEQRRLDGVRQRGHEEDTFEFDMSPPGQNIIRVMSTRRVEPPITVVAGGSAARGARTAASTSDHSSDEDGEKTEITIIATDNGEAKKKKKTKKKVTKRKAPAEIENLMDIGGDVVISDDDASDTTPQAQRLVPPSEQQQPTSGDKVTKKKIRRVVKKKTAKAPSSTPTPSFQLDSESQQSFTPLPAATSPVPSIQTLANKFLSSSPEPSLHDKKDEGLREVQHNDGTHSFGGNSSIDMDAIFGVLDGDPSITSASKPSSRESKATKGSRGSPKRGKKKAGADDDAASLVPSITISGPAARGTLEDEYNLDLSFSEMGADFGDVTIAEDAPVDRAALLGARQVMDAFATPRGTPSLGDAIASPDAMFTKVKPLPPAPSKDGASAYKILHGIEDPFHNSSTDDEDEEATTFKKASGTFALLNENDPYGFAGAVRQSATTPETSDVRLFGAPPAADGRRGSFKLHPLKDTRKAVIEGAISNKVVQHNLEDRWEAREDEWSLPSADDSTDTEGDDEEGWEYFPAPIVTHHALTGAFTALLLCIVLVAFFYIMKGIDQPPQLCVTNFVFIVFLVDFCVIEPCIAGLILVYRVWLFNEDGSHERSLERHNWRTAIQRDCKLHPFNGELKQHMIPPLREGKKRKVRDEAYQFGVPAKEQPKMQPVKPHVRRDDDGLSHLVASPDAHHRRSPSAPQSAVVNISSSSPTSVSQKKTPAKSPRKTVRLVV